MSRFTLLPRAITGILYHTARAAKVASVGAVMLAGTSGEVRPQAREASPAERCLTANPGLSLGVRLPRTAERLKSNEPLKIVAIGSSSTVGLWVLASAATYPEVMRRELLRLRSNATISVVNSGRIGDTIQSSIARFERDVLAHRPDLVVWQLGTNDVVWGDRPDQLLKNRVVEGVRALKAASTDVVLMDLQYAPMVLASAHHSTAEAIIADVTKQERVGLFSRFALMRNSIDAGVAQGALVSWDGLHNTAEGYDCIGRALARAISNSSR
ncbi:SGNH/GDSL hydrolase family protein [Bradyrhizobium lablabi]|uniref:SGNH/GDSL hydrolase family protein n=1 Tax=Bradyrhizobium lablabi TaxID=722472 RepID=UPI002012108D|nr:SGNH/GDSL hydrolase family protein [Bradyrhizobium lablabi]